MRRKNETQNPTPADIPQADAVRSRTHPGRRIALILLFLFVVAGASSLIYFGTYWLPMQYRRQAAASIAPMIRAAQIDDVIRLGVYEQDNDESNGSEPIEWLVLDRQEDRCLLMSLYGLDCIRFNAVDSYATWDQSSILTWLNNTFYYDAFSGAERVMILKTTQKTDINPYFDTYPGDVTNERVFLANIAQIAKYIPEDEQRLCAATPYTIARGATVDPLTGNCYWWLRSPGFDTSVATRIMPDGRINYCGYRVKSEKQAVRPWMWVSVDPNNTITEE